MKQASSTEGFTLIETLIAFTILSLSLIVAMQSINLSARHSIHANNQWWATNNNVARLAENDGIETSKDEARITIIQHQLRLGPSIGATLNVTVLSANPLEPIGNNNGPIFQHIKDVK